MKKKARSGVGRKGKRFRKKLRESVKKALDLYCVRASVNPSLASLESVVWILDKRHGEPLHDPALDFTLQA
ncbi:hypothetical protein RRG08_027589 [Elysia crispata]|uniref:Uncharacterized protein n=1 Tax=Elysia crispata TaxID=231223 RepID=A0AAE1DXF5_9GAST|nr:hypothetical protein RRG08_027589 [Elysia crispata]